MKIGPVDAQEILAAQRICRCEHRLLRQAIESWILAAAPHVDNPNSTLTWMKLEELGTPDQDETIAKRIRRIGRDRGWKIAVLAQSNERGQTVFVCHLVGRLHHQREDRRRERLVTAWLEPEDAPSKPPRRPDPTARKTTTTTTTKNTTIHHPQSATSHHRRSNRE